MGIMNETTIWNFKTTPQKLLKGLMYFIICMISVSLFFQALKYAFHLEFTALNFIIFLFNVDQERNLPTFFSVLFLLIATLMLYSISVEKSAQKDRFRFHWWFMAILFFMVAADEFMATHELISEIVRDKYQVTGIFYYAWVIPFGILIMALGVIYSGFIFRYLPVNIRNLMILSAALYVGGSIGMEMVGSYFYLRSGAENMTNAVLTSIEEGLEMTGISVFIYSLALYRQLMEADKKMLTVKQNLHLIKGDTLAKNRKRAM